jgi:hypothetical protein
MADKYPLVSNTSTLTIEELPVGDTLKVDNLLVTSEGNIVGNLVVGGNVTVNGSINANLGNVVVENLTVEGQTNLGAVGNVTIDGGDVNFVLRTDGLGNLSWANITSEIAVPGGPNQAVQFNSGNAFTGDPDFKYIANTKTLNLRNLETTQSANLGSVSNVYIFGGTSGQILTTDGAGNLSWIDDATDPTVADGGNAGSSILYVASLNSGNAYSVY